MTQRSYVLAAFSASATEAFWPEACEALWLWPLSNVTSASQSCPASLRTFRVPLLRKPFPRARPPVKGMAA